MVSTSLLDHQPLADFFEGLREHLGRFDDKQRKEDLERSPRFNVFDYLKPDELALSWILRDLLDPKGSHGQGVLFLESFLECAWLNWPEARSWTVRAVYLERPTEKRRRIDIEIVFDNGARLAVENKPKADDQIRQIDDYLDDLLKRTDRVKLLYLSGFANLHPDPHSCSDVEVRKAQRVLKLASLQRDIPQWLEAIRPKIQAPRIADFVNQLASHLRTTYAVPTD